MIELRGSGRGGIGIGITMRVLEDQPGSRFRLLANLSGGLLSGPVGRFMLSAGKNGTHQSVLGCTM